MAGETAGIRGVPLDPQGTLRTDPRSEALENTFSWSRSRENAFNECPRRYYYAYYGSWGGWDVDADERTRRLWLLKQLQSRHMWIGDLVHRTCAFALTFARHHGSLPPERELVKHLDHAMRDEFRASRANALHETGTKQTRLLEHELEERIPDGEWRTLHARAVRAVRAFAASEIVERAIAATPSRWLAIEGFGGFVVDAVPVSVRVDFAFDDGRCLNVVDWKTGARASRAATLQLACYALYASETWHAPIERVRTLEVNLVRGETDASTVSREDVEETRRRIVAGATKLRARLDDPQSNVASEEAFEKAESLRACRRCMFQRVCLGGRAVDVLTR